MKSLLIALIILTGIPVFAQPLPNTVSLETELSALSDPRALPQFRTGTIVRQISSFDTTGGNNDGFGGEYSFVKRNADSSLVIFDVKGPGVINRIWTPTPTRDTLDFYVDDMNKPAISVNYADLFSGKVSPFLRPLSDTGAGGYYTYFPILFQQSCRIVCRGKKLQFHQLQYRLFPEGTKVASFNPMLSPADKLALDKVKKAWNGAPASWIAPKAQLAKGSFAISPGQKKEIFRLDHGGRVVGFELEAGTFSDSASLQITWDGDQTPAVDCPLPEFFGYAFGVPSMRSILLGTTGSKHYVYFPMPFDRSVSVQVSNKSTQNLKVQMKLTYTDEKRKPQTEGKFYCHFQDNKLDAGAPYHEFLHLEGHGHIVGVILQAQGRDKGTRFFEGDDTTSVDGQFRVHGTGSEDYFNGGWYEIKGRWDTARSLPLSGCLAYSTALGHTGGYRLYLSDKISFDKSIYHAIEHAPTPAEGQPVHYRSACFYYFEPNSVRDSASVERVNKTKRTR